MESIEKNGNGKAEQPPKPESQLRVFPPLESQQIHLDAQEGAEEAHAEAHDKDQSLPLERVAEGIKGKHDESQSGGVEGVAVKGSRSDVRPEREIRRHEFEIIPAGIIVAEVEVAIVEQAVGEEKIMGFISVQGDSPLQHQKRSEVKNDQGKEEKDGQLLGDRQTVKSVPQLSWRRGAVLPDPKDMNQLEVNQGCKHGQPQESQARIEVILIEIKPVQEGHKKKEKKREEGPKISSQDSEKRDFIIFGDFSGEDNPKRKQNKKKSEGQTQEWSRIEPNGMVIDGKMAGLMEKHGIKAGQSGPDQKKDKVNTEATPPELY